MNFDRKCVGCVLFFIICFVPSSVCASSSQPNLQEMHAQHELALVKEQKQQQAAIFKKHRDELLVNYKSLLKARNEVYAQMKISERDYKISSAKLNKAQDQINNFDAQISQIKENRLTVDKKKLGIQLQRLQNDQTKVILAMKNYSQIQQESYAKMQNTDSQYRNLVAKEQILKDQIDSVQRQLQFVLSQP
jgi:hypothetical protein